MKNRTVWMSISLALAVVVLTVGCYSLGTPYGEPASIGDVDIINKTRDVECSGFLAQAIREKASADPAFTLKDTFPQYDFHITLEDIRHRSLASAEMRTKRTRNEKSNAYQTVLYRIELKARVEITKLGEDKPCIQRVYTATADIPKMHDHDIPRIDAMKQASKQLADSILNDLAVRRE